MYLRKREKKIKHSLANESSSSKHNFSINSKLKRNLLKTFEIHKKNHFISLSLFFSFFIIIIIIIFLSFFFFSLIKLGRVIENKKPRNGGFFNNRSKLKIQYDLILYILDKVKKWAQHTVSQTKEELK